MIIVEFLQNTALTLLYTIGIIVIFGLLIGLCNTAFYYAIGGRSSWRISVATGIIGTPIHELGHAMFCVIFGHKITQMNLFKVDKETGQLGMVEHSYNPKNIYQRMGNFFIGIGPIILGTGVLIVLFLALNFSQFNLIVETINEFISSTNNGIGMENISGLFMLTFDMIAIIFSKTMLTSVTGWIFIILASFIALHMKLSKSDIKNSGSGIIFWVILVVIYNIIAICLPTKAKAAMLNAVAIGGSYVFCFLLIALVFSVVLTLIAGIYFLIRQLIKG